MTSPATILAGCRRATSTAAASRDRADASGGAQACSHARAAWSSRSTGSRSTPTLPVMGGSSAGGGMTRSRAVCAGPDPVPVAVQLQPQPGPGTQVDQGHWTGGSGGGRDAQGDLSAPGHLVHLVPAAAADLDDVFQARPAERLECRKEPVVELRLGAAGFGEVADQRDRPVAPHQEGNGRAGQQRGQPVSRERGQALQQLVISRDRLEQRGGQPP
jgi:hypothetical protein